MLKYVSLLSLILVFPAYAGEHATLKTCYAARDAAIKNNNEWEASFSPMECKVIEARAVKAGFIIMNPKSSKKAVDSALGVLDAIGK